MALPIPTYNKSYIQYVDEFQNLKVMNLLPSFDGNGKLRYYFLSGTISVEYFIVSVFIDQKRADSVSFKNIESNYMLSFINDITTQDLSVIARTEYFVAGFSPQIEVNSVSSLVSASLSYYGSLETALKPNPIALTDKYGVVFPTIVTKKNYQGVYGRPFPLDRNVKTLELQITPNAGSPIVTKSTLTYLSGKYGDFNSGEYYHDYDHNNVNIVSQPCFNIDDIFIKFFDWNITFAYLFRITVYPNYNFVVVDCDGFDVSSLEENHNYTSTRRINYTGQDSNYLLVGLDWKRYPTLFGS